MIDFRRANEYCCEDISLIENYEVALSDETKTWHCHHRNEIDMNLTSSQLIDIGMYYNRPANELIFLTPFDHMHLHGIGERNPMYGKNAEDFMTEEAILEKRLKYGKSMSDFWANPENAEVKENMGKKVSYWHKNPENAEKKAAHDRKISEALKGRKLSDKTKELLSEAHKGKSSPMKGKSTIKYYWQTPEGEIKIMAKGNAIQHHPDWVLIGPVE